MGGIYPGAGFFGQYTQGTIDAHVRTSEHQAVYAPAATLRARVRPDTVCAGTYAPVTSLRATLQEEE